MQEEVVNVEDACTHFDALLKRVASGLHVILKQDDKPIAHMWPVSNRVAGLHAGSIKTTPDFDDEIPESYLVSGE